MAKKDNGQHFDSSELRRKISESAADGSAQRQPPVEMNPFARQIANQFRDTNYSPIIVTGQLRLLEFGFLLAIGLAAHTVMNAGTLTDYIVHFCIACAGSVLTVLLMQIADCYQIPALRAPMHFMPRVIGTWTVTCAIIAVVLILIHPGQAHLRDWYLVWFCAGGLFLFGERNLIALAIRRWARNGVMERRAVIIGGGKPAKDLIRALEEQPDNDIRICGIFDDRGSARSPDVIAGYPKLGTFPELTEFARLAHIDMMIISLPLSAEERIFELLKSLWVLPVDIRLAAHSNSLRFRPRSYSHVGAVPMLDILDKPIRDWDSVAKRAFDIFFSLLALFLLWPLMVATAIAVKATSKGPALFVQKRHGFNNEEINVLKFRSMYTEMTDHAAKKVVTKDDPRVTPIGRYIRKLSIDELPQLFNVLKGDLSLVGPRPHAVLAQSRDRMFGEIVEGYFARHRVKPGVTGWAQINGWRGEIDNDDKIKFRTAYDLFYIENWSLLFDLKILFLTPIKLLNTENAY